jgi:hypothetical protein
LDDCDPRAEFWNAVLRAVEVEPRSAKMIQGASGAEHPIVAVGIDEERRRVVMISGEGDARSASLAQTDIQAAMPSLHVMMARPIAVDLAEFVRALSGLAGSLGRAELDRFTRNPSSIETEMRRLAETLNAEARSLFRPFRTASLDLIGVCREVIQQHAESLASDLPASYLGKLLALDPASLDRSLGICPVPLHDFSEQDVHILQMGTRSDVEAVREVLRRQGILQYFFPPPDHLALGLAERAVKPARQIVGDLLRAPTFGHPFAAFELVDSCPDPGEVIAALQEGGLLVEGDAGVAVTERGKAVRAQVRTRPREGLVARLTRALSIEADPGRKDLFERSGGS